MNSVEIIDLNRKRFKLFHYFIYNFIELLQNFESEPDITVASKTIDVVNSPKLEQNVSE